MFNVNIMQYLTYTGEIQLRHYDYDDIYIKRDTFDLISPILKI